MYRFVTEGTRLFPSIFSAKKKTYKKGNKKKTAEKLKQFQMNSIMYKHFNGNGNGANYSS